MSFTIKLSQVPPSLHQLYGQGHGRRFKKPDYVRWQKLSQAEIVLQGSPKLDGVVDVLVRIPREAVRASSDADNRLKASLDLLTSMRVIPDDSSKYVNSSKAEFVIGLPMTEIVITPVDSFQPIGNLANEVVAKAGEAMRGR